MKENPFFSFNLTYFYWFCQYDYVILSPHESSYLMLTILEK